ncbi:MAG: hypothetical protein KME08_05650 [Aphanothece sp. CMT-3BRIN-NPC111]|nr:hypothetical protein [Aphanothece sp. CMT-3BRIN-NPC111]
MASSTVLKLSVMAVDEAIFCMSAIAFPEFCYYICLSVTECDRVFFLNTPLSREVGQ